MNYRPLSITLISFVYLLSPILKTILYSFIYQKDPLLILSNIIEGYSPFRLFTYFLVPLIQGLSIFKVRKWSFWVFLACEALTIQAVYKYILWLNTVNFPNMMFFYLTIVVGTFFATCHFLLPAIRLAYIDPRLRWWESAVRYQITTNCVINENTQGLIKNISESGLFITGPDHLESGSVIPFEFEYLDKQFKLLGRVVHSFEINGEKGFGIQFYYVDRVTTTRKDIKNFMKYLDENNVERRPRKRTLKESLLDLLLLFTRKKN